MILLSGVVATHRKAEFLPLRRPVEMILRG
jgi:hypothetical protein